MTVTLMAAMNPTLMHALTLIGDARPSLATKRRVQGLGNRDARLLDAFSVDTDSSQNIRTHFSIIALTLTLIS